MVPFMR